MTELEQVVQSGERAPRTKTQYLGRVRDFIAFAGADPANWTMITVERWRDHLIARGVSAQVVGSYLVALRYASKRFARARQDPRLDFAQLAEPPHGISGNPDPLLGKGNALTENQCRSMLRSCSAAAGPMGLRDRALFLIGLHAALRREELATLELEQIRGARLSVVVKGRRWHTVAIGGEALEAAQTWCKWLEEQGKPRGRVFRSLRASVEGAWIIGESLSPRSVYRILKGHAENAGVREFHPHRLRHTFVTMAREAGWPDWKIRQVTGHMGPEVTGADANAMTDHYSHDRDGEALGSRFPEFEHG